MCLTKFIMSFFRYVWFSSEAFKQMKFLFFKDFFFEYFIQSHVINLGKCTKNTFFYHFRWSVSVPGTKINLFNEISKLIKTWTTTLIGKIKQCIKISSSCSVWSGVTFGHQRSNQKRIFVLSFSSFFLQRNYYLKIHLQ